MADQIFIADGLDVDFSQRLDRTGRRGICVHRELGQTRNLKTSNPCTSCQI